MSNNFRKAIDAVTTNSKTKGPYQPNWKGLIDAIRDAVGSGGNSDGGTPPGPGGGFSGDYNDLTNKPDINDGQLTIKNSDGSTAGTFTANQAGSTDITLPAGGSGGGGFSGDYNDLTNQPDIPENTSDLNNDSGFITAGDIPWCS